MNLARRRASNLALAGTATAAILVVAGLHELALGDSSEVTGWALVGTTGFLALFNTRKKLPVLPLLSSAIWLQLHIYVGLLTAVVFLVHTDFRVPNGVLDTGLWLLFVTVAISGVVGLLLSRLVPERLDRHGERILFERIPEFRARLAREVEEFATRSVTELSSTTIADYYAKRLQPFFHTVRNRPAHLLGYTGPLQTLVGEIDGNQRYLNDTGKQILDEIKARVIAKNNLDYQHTWQQVLKGWLFVHVPLTYALLLVVPTHILLAYGFAMGGP